MPWAPYVMSTVVPEPDVPAASRELGAHIDLVALAWAGVVKPVVVTNSPSVLDHSSGLVLPRR